MGKFDEGGQAKEAEVVFTDLLRELTKEVDEASYNADAYRSKVNTLDYFTLESDEKELKTGTSPSCQKEIPDTVINKLRAIVNQLRLSNRKNDEILKHFNSLI